VAGKQRLQSRNKGRSRLTFVKGAKVKLRFLCVGGFGVQCACEAHSKMQSMSLLGGCRGMPQTIFEITCSEIESGAF